MTIAPDPRPLVLHVVFRFDTGGLENGLVNLINGMPEQAYRHAVLSLKTVSNFRDRVKRKDTEFLALNKAPGHALGQYSTVWKLLRSLQPAVVHTRNLGPIEMQAVAAAACGAARIHGEHGRDIDDVDGNNVRYQIVRRVYSPFVHRYVALSSDLQRYLVDKVRISEGRIEQIYNGVDSHRFCPSTDHTAEPVDQWPFDSKAWVIGTVGRMQRVKNPVLLARAFARALALKPELKGIWRLVMVGDGPIRAEVKACLEQAGLMGFAWLPGERSDVPALMRRMQCFVLPSLSEGVSNTILEAMACGLPVIATRVGGNAELIDAGRTGMLVKTEDTEELAHALIEMHAHPELSKSMGRQARLEVEERFSMESMVAAYQRLYGQVIERQRAKTG